MKILLVSATKLEVEPILSNFIFIENLAKGFERYSFQDKHTIDVLVTGVSMVATAYKLGKYLNKSYNLTLNLGVCGAFNHHLKIGEVVHVAKDCFSEMGVQDGEQFLSLIDIDLLKEEDYPLNKQVLENGFLLPKTVKTLKQATAITVNTVTGNADTLLLLKQRFDADVESMEGAAFMYAALKENVPFFQIRAVSNYVEQRDKSKWNIPLAVKNVNEKVLEIIDELVLD